MQQQNNKKYKINARAWYLPGYCFSFWIQNKVIEVFSVSMLKALILSFSLFSGKLVSYLFLFQVFFSLNFLLTLKVCVLLFSTHHAHNYTLVYDKTLRVLKHCLLLS